MIARIPAALAVADFRERTRRPAYVVTLAAAVMLGYVALPPTSSLYVVMNAGGYRGIYNSAYVGTATALAGGLWLMFAVPGNVVKPAGASTALVLAAAWIWPALIWSRLGTQRHDNGLDTLLDAYPSVYRQMAAEWTAGLLLTALTGLGPLLRMAATGDGPGMAAWTAGALFIPAIALMLGTASRTHRMFQALYVIVWYAAVNQVKAADYMGTVLVSGHPAGPSPLFTAGIALAMLTATFTIRAVRHATR
jgi:hypothetical protein